jgi:hypothetical protein
MLAGGRRLDDNCAVVGDTALYQLIRGESQSEAERTCFAGFRTKDTQPPRGDEVTFQSLRHREIIAEEGGHWRLKVPLEIAAVRAFSAGGAVRGSPDYAEGYAVEHRTFGKLLDQLKELTAAQAENWLRHCAGGAMGTRFVGLSSSGCPKTPKCPRCGAAHIRSLTSLPQRRKDYHGERL